MIKIANNRSLDYLIGEIPRKMPVYVSCGNYEEIESSVRYMNNKYLLCTSEYPATLGMYEEKFKDNFLCWGINREINISDHTTNFGLWYRYQPNTIEWHFGLEDSTGLDAGAFMRTPKQLQEVL
jgi:hypothetical protein